tara:strand:+ start:4555 stop:5475 length:921 start_codon:yes stop_codon:yes gene_type:complete
MPYTIDYSTSSKTAIVVNDGTVDTTTSLSLIGKNYTNFGELLNEDLLHMLENFANASAPTNPTEGQLWYDTANSVLKLYDNGQWYTMGAPAGTTRIEYRNRQDTAGVYHKTIELIVDNNIVSITTDDTTVWTPHATEFLEDGTTALTTQFATIQAGIQMNSTANYKFRGTATSAEYADLAERYAADQEYDPGTVVRIDRGDAEITQTTEEADINVFGIISTAPGFEMNAGAGTDATHPFVALSGRVPCKVVGTIHKGDRLVTSSIPGTARIANPTELADYRNIIGRAMETKTTEEVSLIEVVVGAK